MICIKEQYFKFNRIILLIVGLWPYQQSTLVRAQLALYLGVLMSYIVFQVHSYFWYYILLFNDIIYYFTKYHQNENTIFWYYILINTLLHLFDIFLITAFQSFTSRALFRVYYSNTFVLNFFHFSSN